MSLNYMKTEFKSLAAFYCSNLIIFYWSHPEVLWLWKNLIQRNHYGIQSEKNTIKYEKKWIKHFGREEYPLFL